MSPGTPDESESVFETIKLVILWFATVAVGLFSYWAFAVLKRKLDITNYLKKCPAGTIYLICGSVLRSLTGVGKAGFNENAMLMEGKLGPSLLWPLIVLLVIDVISFIAIFSGGQGIIIGGLGTVIILAIYSALLKRNSSLSVAPGSIASVICSGPVIMIRFKSEPVRSLSSVRLFLPPDQRLEFFRRFDGLFPEKLPSAYIEALRRQ
ncbi:MAG TPA: hypothetical protein VM123_13865 [archaeon]|nr:hypothetical protein [archaeon]